MLFVSGCSLGERSRKLKQLDHDLTGEGLDNKQLGHDLTGEGLDNKQLGQDLDLDNEDLDHNLDLDDELQDLDDEEYVENLSIEVSMSSKYVDMLTTEASLSTFTY